MKKQFFSLSLVTVFTVLGAISIVEVSCKKDACDKVTCQHNGTCLNGTCNCPTGYSGTNCEMAASAQYTGTYYGTDAGTLALDTVVIAADTGAYGVLLTTQHVTCKGTIYNDSLTIPSQTVGTAPFTGTMVGSGIIRGSAANITYTITGSSVSNISFTGTKR